ncbi:HD domain-containing phosphohydrolase [uncultured Castellaniella sp.]|uniref:HD domain-containing phosphohydrolase n=1 Tax=uncultured Castellaniella sp. TaxID=647907 RepID=UPI00261B47DB|nr:HD domain-containing phosphohydrolase [uncultured Castellaniella sp.]
MPQVPRAQPAWPVRLVIAGLAVAAMALVAVALITLSWYGSRAILLDMAAMAARDTGRIVAERAHRFIEPGSLSLRVLAFDPVADAQRLEHRLARRGALATELADNPLVSAISVGYENGDFLLMRALDQSDIRERFQAPARASYLVQVVELGEDGKRRGLFLFYDAGNELVLRRPEPDYQFDPRARPWYIGAMDAASTVTSRPYVFFSTRQVGITLSRRSHSGRAIVAVDVALKDLGEALGSLRMTPSAELALVDEDGAVIGYRDMQALLVRKDDSDEFALRTLDGLGIDALTRLQRAAVGGGQVVSYESGGREWFGMALPFDGIDGVNMRLLTAAPAGELLGPLVLTRTRMILISVALIVLFLPVGWLLGSAVGRALEAVSAQSLRMSRFDFRRPKNRPPSALREVEALNGVMDKVADSMESLLDISRALGAEPRMDTMLVQVLEKLVRATRCEGGAAYLFSQDRQQLVRAAAFGEQAALPDSMSADEGDAALAGAWREGRDHHCIAFALLGRDRQSRGLLMLIHDQDWDHAAPEFAAFADRLTGMLAVAVETRQLIEAQRKLFESVTHILADAIDAKSPYTGGHCERVPKLAILLAERMQAEDSGPYGDFHLDEDEREAFRLAAWLHDCGKVTSPEHIMDKATKLEIVYNRIHEIRMRFEALWRDAEIDCLRARLRGDDSLAAESRRDARQAQLREDFRFVAQCNIGGESLSSEAIGRLRALGEQTWLRHFDDALGLDTQEGARLAGIRPEPPALPVAERLLADQPQHVVAWDDARRPPVARDDPRNTWGFDMTLPEHRRNMGELHNLTIQRGTLTAEDRFAINDHIVQTLIMLTRLPWPPHLRRVPDIAANHHERMDGKGYPRRLRGEQLGTTERIVALADVFEALTAADRPYKAPKSLSESLRIMASMCREGHLDPDLFRYFVRSRVWLDYARAHMRPEQIDEVDVEAMVDGSSPRPLEGK